MFKFFTSLIITILSLSLANAQGKDYQDGPNEVKKWLGGGYASTKYDYDKYGKTILVVDPCNNVTETVYGDNGNVTWIIQGKNFSGTVDSPPDNGNTPYEGTYTVVSKTYNIYSGTKLRSTEIRDVSDNVVSMTVNTYDDRNRMLNTVQVDVNSAVDFENFRYLDDINQLAGFGEDISAHAATTYHYDENSMQAEWVRGPANSNTYFVYDENGRQEYSYYLWQDPAGEANDVYVFNMSEYDDQGRVIKTKRVTDSDNNPSGGDEVILSQTTYDSIGKIKRTTDSHGNYTDYFYDQLGNTTETQSYDSNNVLLTITRTLYDTEGAAIITVGPYDPNVYTDHYDDANMWPVGSESVYDAQGRVIETRRWAGVKIFLSPFKMVSGNPVPCAADDAEMAGRISPPGLYPDNAWDGLGTEPNSIGWTSCDKLPVVKSATGQGQAAPLSYSRTIYDVAGQVLHSVSLDETGYEQVTSFEYDIAGKQIAVIDPCGHDIDNPKPLLAVRFYKLLRTSIPFRIFSLVVA